MSTHNEHIDLFDRYLKGQLTSPEKESFEKRLVGDRAFADDFRIHNILVLGIRDHGRQELKAYLKEHGKKLEAGFNPRMRRLSMAVAAIMILFLGVFVVMNYYVSAPANETLAIKKEQPPILNAPAVTSDAVDSNFSPAEKSASKESDRKMEESVTMAEEAAPAPAMEKSAAQGELKLEPVPVMGYPSTQNASMDFNPLNIVSEKKLKDTLITAQFLYGDLVIVDDFAKSETKYFSKAPSMNVDGVTMKKDSKKLSSATPSNRSNHTSDADNSNHKADTAKWAESADTKDKEATAIYNNNQSKKSLVVEFWQSPINFKGYKYTGNKLSLYGMDQADIKIYIYKDKTYMRNKGQVYVMETCENGCPFKPEEDKILTEFILKQP